MDFTQAIKSMMGDIRDGSTDPFLIYRDPNGDWHCDCTQNQYGEVYDWVETATKQDPLSLTFTGKDFSQGSYPFVYDRVLSARISREYYVFYKDDENSEEYAALAAFFEENASEFDHKVTDYLFNLERPLKSLYEMCSFTLIPTDEGMYYDEYNRKEAIESIENEVFDRLRSYPKEEKERKKHNIDGYVETQSFQIAGHLVILAENEKANEPYMVCYCKWDNPINLHEYYNICTTDDYIEAMGLYAGGIQSFVNILDSETARYNNPKQTLTAADCIAGSLDTDLKGKYIVIKPEVLSPEYRRSEKQIKLCTDGFGASPDSRGNAVFCKDLYSGKESRFERRDIAGVIDPEKMPEWAAEKIALLEAINEPGVFKYGNYHFKPYRKFERRDGNFIKQMKNVSSDRSLGISIYNWGKTDYSHASFYAASGGSKVDIFKCIENGKVYLPCEGELFLYNEPPVKEQTRKPKKPSLLDGLESAKTEANKQNAVRDNIPKPKKNKEAEVG